MLLTAPILLFQGRAASHRVSFSSSEMARTQGPLAAPVRLVEYSNFRCPACHEVQPTLAHLLGRYPGKIRYEFRHFPAANDRRSVMAHLAAEAAAAQGRFWPYHHRLFQDRARRMNASNPLESFLQFAVELGLDEDRFSMAFVDPETLKRVEQDLNAGRALGVRATPAFFIQGHVLVGPRQFEQEAEKWIQEALQPPAA